MTKKLNQKQSLEGITVLVGYTFASWHHSNPSQVESPKLNKSMLHNRIYVTIRLMMLTRYWGYLYTLASNFAV